MTVTETRRVYVGLGSNIEPASNIRAALGLLEKRFGALECSRVYRSEAVGFEGAPFLNLVVTFETSEGWVALKAALEAIEDACGRDRSAPRYSSRTLDADLLLYGTLCRDAPEGPRLPHPGILSDAFVLAPLAEIAPDLRHPESDRRYADLWAAYDKSGLKLRPVHFDFRRADGEAQA